MSSMTELRPSRARRRPRFDPRLLLGATLVVVSVAGVAAIVGAADHRVTVFAAAATFAPGDTIGTGDVVARQVTLDDAAGLYLSPADLSQGSLVANAIVRRGELVPRSAIGSPQGAASTSLVLQLAGAVSESVVAGASVDVWASSSVEPDPESPGLSGFGPPAVIASDAIVVRVIADDGLVSAGGQAVEVLVSRERIARMLQAIANGDALAVVPAGIPIAP